MRFVFTVVDQSSTAADYQVDTAADSTVGELTQALADRSVSTSREPPRIFVDGMPLDPRLTLADAPLRQGSLLGLGRPVTTAGGELPGLVEVRVVGGTGAGAVHRLDIGEHLLGTATACRVRLSDPGGAAVSARLRITPDGKVRLTPVDGAGLWLDRREISDEEQWIPGAQLTVGSPLLEVGRSEQPDAALEVSEDRIALDYNRPPRLLPAARTTRFTLPSPPTPPERRPLPYITALAPLVVSGTLFLVTLNKTTLLLALLSPLVVLGNQLANRRQGRQSYRQKRSEYEAKKQRISDEADEALAEERAACRANFPDPANVLLTVTGPRRRLDPDYLELRAGSGDLPSDVVLTDPTQDEHRREVRWNAMDVPVTVALREHGVVGVAGGDGARAVGHWFVAQAAALHSPEDLQVYLLAGSGETSGWQWTRWLPHTAPCEGQDTFATVATDTQTLARRIAELSASMSARASTRTQRDLPVNRDILVVFDGARRLRSFARCHPDPARRSGRRHLRNLPGRAGSVAAGGVPGRRRRATGRTAAGLANAGRSRLRGPAGPGWARVVRDPGSGVGADPGHRRQGG